MMKSWVEAFAADTEDQSEWRLAGWAFVPGDQAWYAEMWLDGNKLASLSCDLPRADVLAAFPAECPSQHVGFQPQVFLPAGLSAGAYILELMFFNKERQELGRLPLPFCIETAIQRHPATRKALAV